MRFAFLVMYELRAIHKTIEQINKRIIDYYNADVFVVCQNQFDDDEQRIKLFKKPPIHCTLYKKPDPVNVFGTSLLKIPEGDNSWKSPGNLQVYINNKYFADILRPYIENYDYFIIMRVDCNYLFDLPPPDLFTKIPYAVYSFHPEYARGWGGSGGGNFVHKNYIYDYLLAYWNILTDKRAYDLLINRINRGIFNQERMLELGLSYKNIPVKYITNINYYYTGETLNDYTTWSKFKIHPVYNTICKYEEQCTEAYNALELWNNGWRWTFKDNEIKLSIL